VLKKDINSIILAVLIMIQPVLDICSFFAIKLEMTAITSMMRLAIFGAIMVYAFILSDKKKVYLIFAGIAGAYWILHMIVAARDGYELVSDFNGFLRTIQMPAMTLGFITLFKHSKKFPEEIGKFFAINYIIIAVSILLSYAVGMPEYTYQGQIGIKGWFFVGNSQSFILSVMAMPAMYYFFHKKCNVGFIVTMVLAFALMFLLGTQVAFYSIFITIIAFAVILIWNREKRWVIIAALAVGLAVSVFAYPYSVMNRITMAEQDAQNRWEDVLQKPDDDPNNDEDDLEQEKADMAEILPNTILKNMADRFGVEKVIEVYGGSIDGAELMDTRQKKVNFGLLVMNEKDALTWLFGCEDADMRHNGETFDPENDFPAIFFFYGIVGVLLYVVFLGYFAILLLKDIFKSLKKLPVDKVIISLSLVLSMGCAELSANVLRRPNASIIISLLLAYAYYICKVKEEPDHETECDRSGI
jgi:ABC-type multidrug transport system fused ATPase/permease subunit